MKNPKQSETLFELQHGAVYIWAEPNSVMIKSVMGNGDPVELSAEETFELAEKLTQLAKLVD